MPSPLSGGGQASQRQAAAAAHPLYRNVFPEIMCQSHKPELDLDFGVGLQFEAVILLDG